MRIPIRTACVLILMLALVPLAERPGLADGPEADHASSLQAKFGPKFPIGVALGGTVPRDYSPAERALILGQFGCVTPENGMKMKFLQPREGEFRFAQADALVDFAGRNHLQVNGHTLVWAKDEDTPGWFFRDGDAPASRELLLKRLRAHIQAVVSRYRGKVASWDVVNEVLDERGEYLRPSRWVSIAGPEFVAKAFQYAREADPDAALIYNDYEVEKPEKRARLLRLLDDLQKQGIRPDGVGIQGHWEVDRVPLRELVELIDLLKARGLKVMVSELDLGVVPRRRWWAEDGKHREEIARTDPLAGGCPPELLERQARQYAELFRIFVDHSDAIGRVTFWGLHDGRNWLNYFPWRHTDYPLLFDRDAKPKPAYRAVMGAH